MIRDREVVTPPAGHLLRANLPPSWVHGGAVLLLLLLLPPLLLLLLLPLPPRHYPRSYPLGAAES